MVGNDWVGVELIDVDNWTLGTGWSRNGTQFTQDGTGNFSSLTQGSQISPLGVIAKTSFEILSYIGSGSEIINDQLITSTISYGTADGLGTFTNIDKVTNSTNKFFSGSTGKGGTIDNVSVKRILQAP